MAAFKDEHGIASEYYWGFVKPGQSFNLIVLGTITCGYIIMLMSRPWRYWKKLRNYLRNISLKKKAGVILQWKRLSSPLTIKKISSSAIFFRALMLRTLRNTVNLSKFNCLFLAPAYCLIVSCVKRLLTDVFIERNDQHYLFCKLFKH